jgi:hypothetical protein
MRQLSTLGLVIFLFMGVAYSAHAQSLSAQQIMDRTISVYATCNSYVDEGEVRTIFLQRNGRRTVLKPFTTAFVRPSDFRFEYKERWGEDEWNSYIIWKDAESVKTWWSIKPGVETPPNLSLALAAATGVSSGSAATVPRLLMPEMTMGNRIKSLSELKLIGEEEVNGRNAYKIEGTDSRERTVTLWVDRESLLIVKIYQTNTFPTFETETTTTYKPQVNVSAQGKLAFNPPEIRKKGF